MRLLTAVLLVCASAHAQRLYHDEHADIPVTGEPAPGFEHVDLFFADFLRNHDLPGASVAIARGGALVYARGFGWADVDAKLPVEPLTRFRIASISKPITSVATLRLVEQGKLSLDDRPFQFIQALADTQPVDERFNDITIDHLLNHHAGFDRSVSGDPMFMARRIAGAEGVPSPPDAQTIARWMTRSPLDTAPGEHEAYSNIGYAILGLAIEQASGTDYETYVREEVLAPLGVTDMQAGATREQAHNESRYYTRGAERPSVFDDTLVDEPYGAWAVEPMIAHGGWIASSVELVRFASAIGTDDFHAVLSPESVELMFSSDDDKRDGAAFYARGWQVRHWETAGRNTWHGGSLPGTSTILVRRRDGLTWAVLFNSREGLNLGGQPAGAVDAHMHRLVNSVNAWPEGDRFESFLAPVEP